MRSNKKIIVNFCHKRKSNIYRVTKNRVVFLLTSVELENRIISCLKTFKFQKKKQMKNLLQGNYLNQRCLTKRDLVVKCKRTDIGGLFSCQFMRLINSVDSTPNTTLLQID